MRLEQFPLLPRRIGRGAQSDATRESRCRPAITSIFAAVFVDTLAAALVLSRLSFFALDLGASGGSLVAMFAAYSSAQTIGMTCLGLFRHSIGQKPGMVLVIIGSAVSFGGFSCAHRVEDLIMLRGLHGLVNGSLTMAQIAIVDGVPSERRIEYLGRLNVVTCIGTTFGYALGARSSDHDFSCVSFVASLLCGLCSLVLITSLLPIPTTSGVVTHASSQEPSSASDCDRLSQDSSCVFSLTEALGTSGVPLSFAAHFCFLVGSAVFEAMGSLCAREFFGAGVSDFNYMLAVHSSACLVFQWFFVSCVVQAFGDRKSLVLGNLCRALAFGFLLARPPRLLAAILVMMGMLGGQLATTCAVIALVEIMPPSLGSVGIGMQHSVAAFGRFVGPLAAGLGYTFDHRFPFLLCFVASTVAAMLSGCLLLAQPKRCCQVPAGPSHEA